MDEYYARTIRGASAMDLPRHCRVASRNRVMPAFKYIVLGFRVVRTVTSPETASKKSRKKRDRLAGSSGQSIPEK